METQAVERAAAALWQAAESGMPISPLRDSHADLGADEAYAVQEINTQRRLQAGGRLVGRKIGLTARSVQQQLGVNAPDFGMLFAEKSRRLRCKAAWHVGGE